MSKLEKIDIDFSQKTLIEKIRLENQYITGAHCFNNIIIWEKKWGLELYSNGSMYAVKSIFGGANTWFFPCGNDEDKKEFIQDLLDEKKTKDRLEFRYMRSQDVRWLAENFPGVFDIYNDDAATEYIISRKEHIELAGKKYHRLKTQVNYVNKNYNITIKPLSDEKPEVLKQIVAMWGEHQNNEQWSDDSQEAMFYIDNYQQCGGDGLVFYLDDEPIAMMGGFPLSENMYDSFLSKTKRPIKGMGAYIKHKFFEHIGEQYEYINIEEDLGIMGLRIMKHGLRPIDYINMHIGKVKDETT